MSQGSLVAIVGRPNVGKSTLFNRLVGSRKAIVDEKSGVTRDRHYGDSEWNGIRFPIIDTGGYSHDPEDELQDEIRKQVRQAVNDSRVLIFVLDVRAGVTDLDDGLADFLRKSNVKVLIAANKADGPQWHPSAAEFHALGLGDVFPISSANGSGTGELLDELVGHLPAQKEEEEGEPPHLAIIGKPNVGKSSLLNTLTGEYRSVVSEKAGTTRDTVDMHFTGFGFDLILVDTAGIRKKGKVKEDLEYYANLRAMRSIERSDVCLLLIDAEEGLQRQDLNIISMVEKEGKGLVILVNKWDLIDKDTSTAQSYEKAIRDRVAPLKNVPVLFTSVTERKRIHRAMQEAVGVHQERQRQVPTSELNEKLLPLIEKDPPPMDGKYRVRIKYVHQLPGTPPAFVFHANRPKAIKPPYKRFLENRLRDWYGFKGVPVRLFFRKK